MNRTIEQWRELDPSTAIIDPSRLTTMKDAQHDILVLWDRVENYKQLLKMCIEVKQLTEEEIEIMKELDINDKS